MQAKDDTGSLKLELASVVRTVLCNMVASYLTCSNCMIIDLCVCIGTLCVSYLSTQNSCMRSQSGLYGTGKTGVRYISLVKNNLCGCHLAPFNTHGWLTKLISTEATICLVSGLRVDMRKDDPFSFVDNNLEVKVVL